jgi:hypothetical protein
VRLVFVRSGTGEGTTRLDSAADGGGKAPRRRLRDYEERRILMQARGRLIIGLAAALGTAVLVSTAAAGPPVKTEFSNIAFSSVMTGVCPFDVEVDSVVSGFEIDYFDQAGNIVKAQIHQVEQDTFSANGKTLTGIPFAFNLTVSIDSNGDPTAVIASGVVEKVPLPDGSFFVSAGRANFVDHPGVTFLLSPDSGAQGNVAGFCAALAP